MSGWAVVGTIMVLFVFATIGLNASLWRRHKAMAARRVYWTEADFVAELLDSGHPPMLAAELLEEIRPYYFAACAPRSADRISRDLAIDPDELMDIVERVSSKLGQPQPDPKSPEHVPELATVGDLARYLRDRVR